jgi:glycine/D-amino acid oxidase-like deaminating enzyme
LKEVYPQLGNVQFDHIWGGKLAFALNAMPLIGRDSDYDDDDDIDGAGVWYATGFGGHGIVPTAMAGSVLANAILGIPDQQQWQLFQKYFPPSSFNGYPYSRLGAGMILLTYNGWEWLGKKSGLPLPALPKLW